MPGNSTVSAMTAASALDGTELLYAVQSSADRKATTLQVKTYAVGAGSVSVASGKTLTVSNTLTLAGTDSTTFTFPNTTGTVAILGLAQTWTAAQTFSSSVLLSGTSGVLGYTAGAGGQVTQATSKSTGVTLNRPSGWITMNNASLAAGASVTFTLTNSTITGSSNVLVSHIFTGTAGAYICQCNNTSSGACDISVYNRTGGALAEAILLAFTVFSVATA